MNTTTDAESAGPLDGLRIVDFSGMIAGGYATMTLADFGADVVAVEHPDGHDPVRDWTPIEDGTSLWWKSLGRNKRCVTLDLKRDEGKALALELLTDADAVVENFRPGTLEGWNLGPDRLREANEELIVVRISGYGQTGPKAERPGFGTAAEALSGFANVNGFPDREPLLPPIALADMAAGMTAVQALLMALFERDVTGSGEGQVVDVSLLESLFRFFPAAVTKYDRTGETGERLGNRHENAAPRNVYETADGYVALSASQQSIFENLAAIIGHPELVADPRFADNAARVEHAEELDGYIAPWIAERTTDEVLDELRAGDAVVAPIYDIGDILADDHYQARGAFVEVDDADLGPVKTSATFPRFSRTPGSVDGLGPRHGEHNRDVYVGEVGLDEETFADLRDSGVI
jgi:crotonobetainyl-CoA:carnitine CoA-transferase CaiB-like acyl-CoA transferase